MTVLAEQGRPGRQRWARPGWALVSAALWACGHAAAASSPGTPESESPPPEGARSAPPAPGVSQGLGLERLPAYYTVELALGSRVYADGRRLASLAELERDATQALDSRRFQGAVVFGDVEADRTRVLAALRDLRNAGFAPVHAVGRLAPREIALSPEPAPSRPASSPSVDREVAPAAESPAEPAPPAAAEPPAPEPPAEPEPPREARAASADLDVSVTLKTVGLHIGGAPNDEASRQRLVRQFETKFRDFRQCYPLAGDRDQNASFGVDLQIPRRGGQAKLKQTRSRLRGKPFRACMHRVFRSMRFVAPPSDRSATVSYSLIFKPGPP